METILSGVTKKDVTTHPFPHIVIENALPEDMASQLLDGFPDAMHLGQGKQGLTKGGKMPNNVKIRYYSKDLLKDPIIPELHKEFARKHSSLSFFNDFWKVFEDEIIKYYPQLKDFNKKMKEK